MALNVSFKPGKKQSMQAACYFNSAAEEVMDRVLESLTAWQYLISLQDGTSIRLRIWSAREFGEDEMEEIMDRLRNLHQDIGSLVFGPRNRTRLRTVVERWLTVQHDGNTFFLEQWDAHTTSDSGSEPELSLCVLGGKVAMMSTNTLMFTQLKDDVHGLSIAVQGSYLLEQEGEDEDRRNLRRA